jgi:hypothetical protein
VPFPRSFFLPEAGTVFYTQRTQSIFLPNGRLYKRLQKFWKGL